MKNRIPLEQLLTTLEERAFLGELRQLFQISLIYYPGCWDDKVLEGPFKIDEIVYLDNDTDVSDEKANPCNLILGDYGKSPFRDNAFDAIFYQDNHANKKETIEMLRTVRPNGIVIYSHNDCGSTDCINPKTFGRLRGLEKVVDLPFYNISYTVFRKLPMVNSAPTEH